MKGSVLITGGYGLLGSWLVRHFSDAGYQVAVLSRNQKSFINAPHSFIRCDIRDHHELQKQLAGKEFDFCIHAASYNEFNDPGYLEKALPINVSGTKNLLHALRGRIKKFAYLSTIHVYGRLEGLITEDSETVPTNDYGMTHLFAEHYVRQFASARNLDAAILRLSNGYGSPLSRDSDKWYLALNSLALSAFQDRVIRIQSNGEVSRDFIWNGDVCRVCEEILNLSAAGIWNVSTGKNIRLIELAQIVREAYKIKYQSSLEITWNTQDLTRYSPFQIDSGKIRSKLKLEFSDQILNETLKIFDLLESVK